MLLESCVFNKEVLLHRRTMTKLLNTARTHSQGCKIQAVAADSNDAFLCE